jgi:peptide deformylase
MYAVSAMATLPIVTGEHSEVLRKKTEKIVNFDKNLKKLVADLLETAAAASGAGLAAPQVSVSLAVTVARLSGSFVPLVNPEVIWQSETVETAEEGCLSLPGVWLMVPRPDEVIIKYSDENGKEQERKLTGWDARITQHEIDHLNRKLIVDY